MNCSALGSLAIEKGFETTVDKLLKELLKKAAGAVGGALGGAAAISGGIVIGMLLSTEEVGESKEELDELEREQEKKKDNEDRNDSGGSKKKKPKQDKEGDSGTDLPEQAGRGQSKGGRHEPANLNEKLSMEEAMTNPENGMKLEGKNTDPRWPAEEGWEKWSQNVNGNEIHYEYNPLTGEIDDVKIK